MGLFSLEQSGARYRADFLFYGTAVVLIGAVVLVRGPHAQRFELAGCVLLGLGAWTAIEYALHRFVLHGLRPFQRWHAEHHRRPSALIGTPTILSGTLFAILVFVPTLVVGHVWRASALTLGLLMGYLFYAFTHHAAHHWHARNAWLRRRQAWHAIHHHTNHRVCFGVTTSFWDHVLRTTPPRSRRYPLGP